MNARAIGRNAVTCWDGPSLAWIEAGAAPSPEPPSARVPTRSSPVIAGQRALPPPCPTLGMAPEGPGALSKANQGADSRRLNRTQSAGQRVALRAVGPCLALRAVSSVSIYLLSGGECFNLSPAQPSPRL
jgi:hypothetical protein